MAHHGYGSRALVFTSALLLVALVTAPARADTDRTVKQGTQSLGEWVDAVKTDHGKEARRFRLEYEWDTGLTHESVYTLDGKLVSERRYRSAPSPSPEEIAEADAVVRADPEIAEIMRRQPDLSLQGGFPISQERGATVTSASRISRSSGRSPAKRYSCSLSSFHRLRSVIRSLAGACTCRTSPACRGFSGSGHTG